MNKESNTSVPLPVLNPIRLIHSWLAGEGVEIDGQIYFFPHGVKHIREFLERYL